MDSGTWEIEILMKENSPDPTKRFSDRVEDYVKYRPEYPNEILSFLSAKCGLSTSSVIADIGSGTGKSSRPFIENGNKIFCIEPNDPMRKAAEDIFGSKDNFHSIKGTAEQTFLADASVDFIIVGQAFHWFDIAACSDEFRRILRSDGTLILMWNKRNDAYPLMADYNEFIKKYSTDYEKISLRRVDDEVYSNLFGKDGYRLQTFQNFQEFDFDGLKGRYESSSYAFKPEHSKYKEAIDDLGAIFTGCEVDGKIKMTYVTELYFGRIRR